MTAIYREEVSLQLCQVIIWTLVLGLWYTLKWPYLDHQDNYVCLYTIEKLH